LILFLSLFRLQERIVARRQEQQIADKQKAVEMEKKRITDGKLLSDLKQKYDLIVNVEFILIFLFQDEKKTK
jgi:hypothetical protein